MKESFIINTCCCMMGRMPCRMRQRRFKGRRNNSSCWDSTTQAAASEDAIQNLIAATTGTVDLSVWASEEDQDLTTQVIEEFKKSIQTLTSTSHSELSQSQSKGRYPGRR
ncbi:MAG: hypothetical protein ACLTDF_11165 [Coprococcus sp.]